MENHHFSWERYSCVVALFPSLGPSATGHRATDADTARHCGPCADSMLKVAVTAVAEGPERTRRDCPSVDFTVAIRVSFLSRDFPGCPGSTDHTMDGGFGV